MLRRKDKEKKLCSYCKRTILIDTDKFVILQTNKGNKIMEKNYYHFRCFQEYWQKKVQETIIKRARIGMDNVFKALNKLQGDRDRLR